MTDTPLEGRLALVTGASRGIGAATAIALAAKGAHVVLTARTPGGLEEVETAIHDAGGSATIAPLDLAESEAIGRLEQEKGVRKDLPVRDWKPRGDRDFSFLTWAAAGADLLGFESVGVTFRQLASSARIGQLDGLLAVWHPAGEK